METNVTTVLQQSEGVNIPTDRDARRRFLDSLGAELRLLLFGVPRDSVTFRCPTNGRIYLDESPQLLDGCLWTRCYWCDMAGRVRGEDALFDRRSPQPHCNPITERP